MNSWDFTSSRLKIKRAKCHINELESRLSVWINSDSFRLDIDKNPDTGNQRFNFTVGESIPEDIPVIIGDAVHNLRSALDFIAIEIVVKAGLGRNDVYFPIRETEAEFIDALSKSKIKLASPDASDVILNRIKPYKAENPFIWCLNRLSNTDKHRLLIPTINQAYFSGIPIEHEYHSETFRGSVTIPGSIAIEFTGNVSGDIIDDTPAQMKIKSHTSPSISIRFNETQIPGILEYEVIYMLKVFSQLIDSYIPMFEAV